MASGYTLVICEKPDAARRVSGALSGGTYYAEQVEGTTVYRFARGGEEFAVCSARGHLFEVSDPLGERAVYPAFDVEWYSSDLVDEESVGTTRRIAAVKKLASGAARFVNACDFDIEGETIGYNILRYACEGKEKGALRAKFSTLTNEEIVKAFGSLRPQGGEGLARAGRARHVVDFVWGVNLSRVLSQAALGSGHRYRTVSVGRVQGPTLGFLVQREREIREFVPVPYWKVSGLFDLGGRRFTAGYAGGRVETNAVAKKIREDCAGKGAIAKSVRRSMVHVGPPAPFNIGDLQREAYRAFGYTPSRTLQIAERLYLGALISYPRTGSQKLSSSINYRSILSEIGKIPDYSAHVAEILKTEPRPTEGAKSDPAHPAIHPTGERPRRALGPQEGSVFDLVVRRFLAAFGPSAKRELVDVTLAAENREFKLSGGTTVLPGWMKYYGRYNGYRDDELPPISEGDRVEIVDVGIEEAFEQKPSRYNQSSLLWKMEKEGIGTKATRADIITTLAGRGYVAGESMEVTDLGLSVAETLAKYSPSIMSTQFTREIEEKLEMVEAGGGEAELLRETVRTLSGRLAELSYNEEAVGKELDSALASTVGKSFVLGECPVCEAGQLMVIRSRTTKKRFAGCSSYPAGCRASAPLPQRGTLKPTAKRCERCHWPMIYVAGAGRPWRLCINPGCPGKRRA